MTDDRKDNEAQPIPGTDPSYVSALKYFNALQPAAPKPVPLEPPEMDDPPDLNDPDEAPAPGTLGAIPVHWHGDPADEEEADPLIADLLPRVGKGLMSGQWGLYKTFVALDACAAVMTGGSFAGHAVRRQGGVLFIAAEGARQIRRRLKALVEGKLRLADPPDEAEIMDLDALPFAWIRECPPLLQEDGVTALIALIRDVDAAMVERFGFGLALVVIDTIAAASGMKDEDNAAEAQRLFNGLERIATTFSTCVLGIDHFGKTVETGTRGSSAKESAADFVLALLGERDLSGDVANTRLAVRKMRDGDTGAEHPFALATVALGHDRWGEPITSGIILWTEGSAPKRSDKPPRSEKRRLIARRFLEAYDLEAETVPFSIGFDGARVFKVAREAIRERMKSRGWLDLDDKGQISATGRSDLTRARADNETDGFIVEHDNLIWRLKGDL